jgi:hypothetical protein
VQCGGRSIILFVFSRVVPNYWANIKGKNMINNRVLLRLINVLNGILLVLFVLKLTHLVTWLSFFTIFHLLIAVIALYGLKILIEVRTNAKETVRENPITKMVFYIGSGALLFGILFRVMHWPFSLFLIVAGSIVILLSYVLGLLLPPGEIVRKTDDEILDDIR